LNAQQREQAIEASIEVAVDAVENLGQNFGCRHGVTFSLLAARTLRSQREFTAPALPIPRRPRILLVAEP
jgi:hypothetical protein